MLRHQIRRYVVCLLLVASILASSACHPVQPNDEGREYNAANKPDHMQEMGTHRGIGTERDTYIGRNDSKVVQQLEQFVDQELIDELVEMANQSSVSIAKLVENAIYEYVHENDR